MQLAVITQTDIVFFAFAILAIFVLIVGVFFASIWFQRNQIGVSPYSGIKLRKASDLPYDSAVKILRYLYDLHQYDNRIFSLKRASFCRETGRVFTNSVTWYGKVQVGWDFLQKRYKGNYVSWGSLSESQQEAIKGCHTTLDGFQTEQSSPRPAPRDIEPEYSFAKPGPLYVDVATKVLIGWKCVPDTMFEVLIVQLPKKQYHY